MSNTCLTQMVNSVRITINQSWCVSSLLMGDYCCGVRKFWLSFIWSSQMKIHSLCPKSCLNVAATAVMLHQSNHQCFLMTACSHWKVEVQYCNKRSLFLGVTACNDMIFNQFPPQEDDRRYFHCTCILVRVGPTYNSS